MSRDTGDTAYRLTSIVTNIAGLAGIPATLIPIFIGTAFQRRAMLATLVLYAPIIVIVLLRLPQVLLRILST
jgi:hypothetical protein